VGIPPSKNLEAHQEEVAVSSTKTTQPPVESSLPGSRPVFRFVDFIEDGRFATITLRRPEKRNALSLELMGELLDALELVRRSSVVGVRIRAEGKVFSAGHDFTDMAGANIETVRQLFRRCTDLMEAIAELPQPVIAQVQGLATAAGCQLIATCDLVVAARSAGFAAPGGKGGLFCHTPMVAIARNIGRKRAVELAFSGDVIDAETACRWGLINEVVDHDQLESATLDLLQRVTRGSSYSKEVGKAALYRQLDLPVEQAYAFALETMAAAAVSVDAQEGIDAFLSKRSPQWSARTVGS
jgi:enoyl-CoA hydratase/carnithine racemase